MSTAPAPSHQHSSHCPPAEPGRTKRHVTACAVSIDRRDPLPDDVVNRNPLCGVCHSDYTRCGMNGTSRCTQSCQATRSSAA